MSKTRITGRPASPKPAGAAEHHSHRVRQRLNTRRDQHAVRLGILLRKTSSQADKPPRSPDRYSLPAWAAHHRRCVIIGIRVATHAARLWRKFIVVAGPRVRRRWKLEVRRHHTNNGRRFTINSNALADDSWDRALKSRFQISLPRIVTLPAPGFVVLAVKSRPIIGDTPMILKRSSVT